MRHENIWDFIKIVKIERSLQRRALTVSYTLSPDWPEMQNQAISLSNNALQFRKTFLPPVLKKYSTYLLTRRRTKGVLFFSEFQYIGYMHFAC